MTDLSPEQAAIEYDRAVKSARFKIRYRLEGQPMHMVAFSRRDLLTVLCELNRMSVGNVVVEDGDTGEARILPGKVRNGND